VVEHTLHGLLHGGVRRFSVVGVATFFRYEGVPLTYLLVHDDVMLHYTRYFVDLPVPSPAIRRNRRTAGRRDVTPDQLGQRFSISCAYEMPHCVVRPRKGHGPVMLAPHVLTCIVFPLPEVRFVYLNVRKLMRSEVTILVLGARGDEFYVVSLGDCVAVFAHLPGDLGDAILCCDEPEEVEQRIATVLAVLSQAEKGTLAYWRAACPVVHFLGAQPLTFVWPLSRRRFRVFRTLLPTHDVVHHKPRRRVGSSVCLHDVYAREIETVATAR
jgi:hypothetical protein